MTTRPRTIIEPRPAPDTTARLESVEKTQRLMMDKLDDITATLRTLTLRDSEMDDRMNKFASEHRKGVEALAETMKSQQLNFNDALTKEADARKDQARQFTEALAKQEERALAAWKSAVMKGVGSEVIGWIKTVGTGGLMLLASYYWIRLKG